MISMKSIKKHRSFVLWIFILILTICSILTNYYIFQNGYLESFGDYLLILLTLSAGEVFCRLLKADRIFIITERIDELKRMKSIDYSALQRYRNIEKLILLSRSSLGMLGIITGLTLTTSVIGFNIISVTNRYDTAIFIVSAVLTFLIFVIDLALCYSLLMLDRLEYYEDLIEGVKQYYYLTMSGLVLLGATFLWVVRTYILELFTVHWFVKYMAHVILGYFLLVLYRVSYIYEKHESSKN